MKLCHRRTLNLLRSLAPSICVDRHDSVAAAGFQPGWDLLGGQLALGPVVVHAIVGDGGELPAAVVLVVDVVCHVLQVLHVSPVENEWREVVGKGRRRRRRRRRS